MSTESVFIDSFLSQHYSTLFNSWVSSFLGSALVQGGEAVSHPVQLMSLNLSRNVVAMEKALRHLEEAERSLDECSSSLVRDVIVSEAQAAEHNRSIVDAKIAF